MQDNASSTAEKHPYCRLNSITSGNAEVQLVRQAEKTLQLYLHLESIKAPVLQRLIAFAVSALLRLLLRQVTLAIAGDFAYIAESSSSYLEGSFFGFFFKISVVLRLLDERKA